MRSRTRATARVRALVAALPLLATPAIPSARVWADGNGAVLLNTSTVSIGQTIQVSLSGWPGGLVSVTVCGNSARRGSEDCNLNSTSAVAVVAGADSATNLTIGAPPVPCPCVIRAATQRNDVVRTAPIVVIGVPVEGLADPSEPLTVKTAFGRDAHESIIDRLRGALGGAQRRVLHVSLRNNTSTVMSTLTLQASVGPSRDNGSPVPTPVVQPLGPGEQRTYDVRVPLDAPSWGELHLFGAVYGLSQPVTFEGSTSSTPWLLYVLGAVLVVDVVAWRVLRRRRRKLVALQQREPDETPGETLEEQTLQRGIAS